MQNHKTFREKRRSLGSKFGRSVLRLDAKSWVHQRKTTSSKRTTSAQWKILLRGWKDETLSARKCEQSTHLIKDLHLGQRTLNTQQWGANNPTRKWAKRRGWRQDVPSRRRVHSQQTSTWKDVTVVYRQGHANQSHWEDAAHPENGWNKKRWHHQMPVRMQRNTPSPTAGGNIKWSSRPGKPSRQRPQNLSRDMKTWVHTKTSTQFLRAVGFDLKLEKRCFKSEKQWKISYIHQCLPE